MFNAFHLPKNMVTQCISYLWSISTFCFKVSWLCSNGFSDGNLHVRWIFHIKTSVFQGLGPYTGWCAATDVQDRFALGREVAEDSLTHLAKNSGTPGKPGEYDILETLFGIALRVSVVYSIFLWFSKNRDTPKSSMLFSDLPLQPIHFGDAHCF